MGAVVTLHMEQKVPASHFFLSYVNAVLVMACTGLRRESKNT